MGSSYFCSTIHNKGFLPRLPKMFSIFLKHILELVCGLSLICSLSFIIVAFALNTTLISIAFSKEFYVVFMIILHYFESRFFPCPLFILKICFVFCCLILSDLLFSSLGSFTTFVRTFSLSVLFYVVHQSIFPCSSFFKSQDFCGHRLD